MSGAPRVALLTNFIGPYRVSLLRALRDRVGALRVFVSTPMERTRAWPAEWGDLDVVVQRGLTVRRTWRTDRFAEPLELHVPVDTIPRLGSFRPDLVVTGEMGARTAQAIAWGRATRTPVHVWATLTEHLERERGGARRRLRQWVLERAAGVIVNGRSGASYIRRFGVPAERIVAIPQTTDIAAFTALPLVRGADDAFRLLVVGSLAQRKGVDLLLAGLARVAERWSERAITLCVVGDGPERVRLQAMSLPASVRVEWVGHVPYHALPAYYARAGILAFPTLGDEWGLVVNEAMAAGVPVLGSGYSQAVTELVEDGTSGWIFAPDSAGDVAAALVRALSSAPDQLARMRHAARAAVAPLTPEHVADRFVHALNGHA